MARVNVDIVLLTFFAIIVFQVGSAANTGLTCSPDSMMEDFEKSLMNCVIHSADAELMIDIIENIKHPQKLLTLDFICRNQDNMAKLANCMAHKYSACLPTEAQKMLVPLFPTEQRWKEIIHISCVNRKVLSAQCMNQGASSEFLKCYKNKLIEGSGLMESVEASNDLHPLLCHIDQSYEYCMSVNSGACSAEYVHLVNRIMAMVISITDCASNGKDKAGNPFAAVLLHGHPLKFKPMGRGN